MPILSYIDLGLEQVVDPYTIGEEGKGKGRLCLLGSCCRVLVGASPVARPNCADGKDGSHAGKGRAAHSVRVSHRLTPTGTLRTPRVAQRTQAGPSVASSRPGVRNADFPLLKWLSSLIFTSVEGLE